MDCTWNNPGADPYTGSARDAIMAFAQIPQAVRAAMVTRAESKQRVQRAVANSAVRAHRRRSGAFDHGAGGAWAGRHPRLEALGVTDLTAKPQRKAISTKTRFDVFKRNGEVQ